MKDISDCKDKSLFGLMPQKHKLTKGIPLTITQELFRFKKKTEDLN